MNQEEFRKQMFISDNLSKTDKPEFELGVWQYELGEYEEKDGKTVFKGKCECSTCKKLRD
jgi:hypothetical protein